MKSKLALLLLTLLPFIVFSQQTITGVVLSEADGLPLPGATIIVSGENIGVTSDFDGKFTLENINSEATITISYVGFETTTLTLSGETSLNILLTESLEALSEVIITGYSSERRVDLTGAISVVELDAIEGQARTSGNPMQALQGRVPGLYFRSGGDMAGSTGNDLADRKNGPPSVIIRGLSTLGDNSPLYVIDGIPTKRQEVFASLSPDSIESVQVLKDASASSIYGSRAANGVIVVSTKNKIKGVEGIKVRFNSSISSQSEKNTRYEMANAVERGQALWQASVNDSQNPTDAYGKIYDFNWNNDFNNPILSSVVPKALVGGVANMPSGDTDWQKELYQTGFIYNNEISIVADNENSTVFMNVGHFKNSGILKFTKYERISAKLNGSFRLFNDKVRVGMNTLLTNSNERLGARDVGGSPTTFLAYRLVPTIPLYDISGVKYGGPIGAGYSDRNNPVLMQSLNKWDNTSKNQFFCNIFVEVDILNNLQFKSNVGLDYAANEFKDIELKVDNGFVNRGQNRLVHNNSKTSNVTWSNTLNYNLEINNHRIGALLGIEAIQNQYERLNSEGKDFAVEIEDYFVMSASTGQKTTNGYNLGSSLYAQFAKLNYGYSDKYLASLTVRRDGSSKFGENFRYGIFPAATIGWRVTNEDFFNENKIINDLKIRAGYGIVGNQEIGEIARFGLYETRYGTNLNQLEPGFWEQYYNIGTAYDIAGNDGGALPSGFVQIQAPNPNLKWEETSEINIGFDFALLDNFISGSFDLFNRETKDILTTPPYPSVLGEGQDKVQNGATTETKGWELQMGHYSKPNSSGLNYNIITTFGSFKDKITFLPQKVISAYPGTVDNSILGQSQTAVYGFTALGLFESQADVDSSPTQTTARPGGIKFKDLNGDGLITDAGDQDFIGNTLASMEYGIRVDLDYKNFDLSIFGSGVTGRIGSNQYEMWLSTSSNNAKILSNNAWSVANTNTEIPSLSLVNNETRTSTYGLRNNSFFKLRNFQLGYNFPSNSLNQLGGMQSLRLYFQGENLAVFTNKDFFGVDPERSNNSSLPIPRTMSLGLNVTF